MSKTLRGIFLQQDVHHLYHFKQLISKNPNQIDLKLTNSRQRVKEMQANNQSSSDYKEKVHRIKLSCDI